MNAVKCANGHYYDSDTYSSCPHCNSNPETDNVTSAYEPSQVQFDMNQADRPTGWAFEQPPSQGQAISPNPGVTEPWNGGISAEVQSEGVTVSIDQMDFFGQGQGAAPEAKRSQQKPVVGWLVCTEGKHRGQDFRLKSGKNFIGRNHDMDVCLDGEETVSRNRHAAITYEPKQNMFIAQPGESRELIYLNGSVVLTPIEIKKNDLIQVGEATLMLIPCCDGEFNWAAGNKK